MQEEALADVAADTEADGAFTLCLFRAEWHQGVVGIVASRLKDRYHRPAIVFARGSGGELKGSGRSIPGFHLRDALDLVAKRAPGVVARFGGHAYAAGLSVAETDLVRFAQTFEAVAREQLTPAHLAQVRETDGALAPTELTLELAQALAGGVWGQGFPAPLFDGVFEVADQRIVKERHSRLVLRRPGPAIEAGYAGILFNHADTLPPTIRAVYRPDANEWNGTVALQLVIEHWEPAPAAPPPSAVSPA
jgi:single-stranded-DNA-specific exonuclease